MASIWLVAWHYIRRYFHGLFIQKQVDNWQERLDLVMATKVLLATKSFKMSHSKMDTNRALGIMGFGNLRWLDPSTGMDPKQALDKALFEKTQKLCASRSNGQTKQPKRGKSPSSANQNQIKPRQSPQNGEEKYVNDVRNLHEAYQLLARKYILVSKKKPQIETSEGMTDFFATISIGEKNGIC